MKNIVVCCDGTGNAYGHNNTNVVELYSVRSKAVRRWRSNERSGTEVSAGKPARDLITLIR